MGDTTTRTGRTIEMEPPTWSSIFGVLLAAHGSMYQKRGAYCEPNMDREWCYTHDADIDSDTDDDLRFLLCDVASDPAWWRAWNDKLNGDYFANIENFRDMAKAADLWNEHVKAEKGD